MIRTALSSKPTLTSVAAVCRPAGHVHRLASVADLSCRAFVHMVGTFRGEQVLILAVGGELDTAFVLPGIYSGDNPAPSASADALHIRFPDGAVIEYEPETSALTVSGIKTASVAASDSVTATVPVVTVKASTRVTLDTPEVVCTNKLTTGTLEVQKGGTMRGNIEHTGGELSSNGKVLHTHKHPGDSGGTTGSPL